MESCWKSSEFWAAIVGPLVSLLVVRGLVDPSDAKTLSVAISKGAVAASALIAQGLVIGRYVHTRAAARTANANK